MKSFGLLSNITADGAEGLDFDYSTSCQLLTFDKILH